MRTSDAQCERLDETVQFLADIALVIKGVMTSSKVNFSCVKWCPIENTLVYMGDTQRTRKTELLVNVFQEGRSMIQNRKSNDIASVSDGGHN